jgi:hypothetical protein
VLIKSVGSVSLELGIEDLCGEGGNSLPRLLVPQLGLGRVFNLYIKHIDTLTIWYSLDFTRLSSLRLFLALIRSARALRISPRRFFSSLTRSRMALSLRLSSIFLAQVLGLNSLCLEERSERIFQGFLHLGIPRALGRRCPLRYFESSKGLTS